MLGGRSKKLERWLAGLGQLVLITIVAGYGFDLLFEEPEAQEVPSLVGQLRSGSVLAILAHPDDEILFAGALGDAAGQPGVAVRTLTLTRGEKGFADPPICRLEDLPAVRVAEALRYGFVLGLDEQVFWDYADGGLADANHEDLVGRIAGVIRSWQPDLVLTFDPASGYSGHEDHKAVGALVAEATRASGDPAAGIEPRKPHRPRTLVHVVAPRRMLRISRDAALERAAEDQPTPDLAVAVDRRLKAEGWRIHASQNLRAAYGMAAWLLYRFYDKEHFLVVDNDEPGAHRDLEERGEKGPLILSVP